MSKTKDEKVTAPVMPEPAAITKTVQFKSENDTAIAALVETSASDAPIIESATLLEEPQRMQLPKIEINGKVVSIADYRPENYYRWVGASREDMQRELRQYGGKYELVTRNNHSFIPSDMFALTGVIMAEGWGNMLAFCRKEYKEAKLKRISADLSLKEKDLTAKLNREIVHAGKTVAVIEQLDTDPGDGNYYPTPGNPNLAGYGPTSLEQEAQYDQIDG